MGKTSIEWTDFSINPIRARDQKTNKVGHHCEKVSAGCQNCYASALQTRFGLDEFSGPSRRETLEHFLDESKLQEVLRRKKPTRYFWCDMSDMFGAWVKDEWIDRCFAVMALTPQHTHQVLTKRPERMLEYMRLSDHREVWNPNSPRVWAAGNDWPVSGARGILGADQTRWGPALGWPLPNVWLGVSVENQAAADERIPLLLQTPAAVRFLSCEPLLGPIEFSDVSRRADAVEQLGRRALAGINWVIIGGESGPSARPMELAWMRFIVRQCQAVQVAVFCKQLGYRASDPTNGIAGAGLNVPEEASGLISLRLRDKKGGDMREWPNDLRIRSFPTPAP